MRTIIPPAKTMAAGTGSFAAGGPSISLEQAEQPKTALQGMSPAALCMPARNLRFCMAPHSFAAVESRTISWASSTVSWKGMLFIMSASARTQVCPMR